MDPNPYEPTNFSVADPRDIEWNGLDAAVRVSQVIVFALLFGAIAFAMVILTQQSSVTLTAATMTWIGVAGAAIAIPTSYTLPPIFETLTTLDNSTTKAKGKSREERLFELFQVQLIMRCAILEGAAFLNIVAFQQEHCLYSILAIVLLVVMIAMRIPTKRRVQTWIAARLS